MLSELGFLSPEIEKFENQLVATYPEVFNLSERLSTQFVRLLQESELDEASVRNLSMNALAAKSLELFQSSILLLKKGCIPAARVVSRAFIETVYKLCAIHLVSDGISRYTSQEKKTRLQKLKGIQKYKEKHPNSGIAPAIDAEIEALSKERPRKTEPNEWASLAQMDDFHNLYYQGMSDDTHGNIESLNHYFDEDSTHLLNFGPSDKGLVAVASACHRGLINAIDKYASFQCITINLAGFSGEIDAIEKQYAIG